jgi:hypothetical protein
MKRRKWGPEFIISLFNQFEFSRTVCVFRSRLRTHYRVSCARLNGGSGPRQCPFGPQRHSRSLSLPPFTFVLVNIIKYGSLINHKYFKGRTKYLTFNTELIVLKGMWPVNFRDGFSLHWFLYSSSVAGFERGVGKYITQGVTINTLNFVG